MSSEIVLTNVARLSENYRSEILSHWLPFKDAYTTDWLEAFDFFLSHIYYQGRRDSLSTRYYLQASRAIREFFGETAISQAKRFDEAWANGWLPYDISWNDFRPENSPICCLLSEMAAGKARDQEMVVDSLRFLRGLKKWNIVGHSCSEITRGRISNHFAELDEIWQVGPKTASFYLRDLCAIYALDPGPEGWEVTQPIDTWVMQIALRLELIQQGDPPIVVVDKILSACSKAGVQPSDFNAGAWYLGTHSLDIALSSMSVN